MKQQEKPKASYIMAKNIDTKPINAPNAQSSMIMVRKISKKKKLEHSCFIIDGYFVFIPCKCNTCKYGQLSGKSDFSNLNVRKCDLRGKINRKQKKYGCEYYTIAIGNIFEIINKYNK